MKRKKKDRSRIQLVPVGRLDPGRAVPDPEAAWRQDHTMLKCKCPCCSRHFVLCTWHPERHSALTIHCPECGQRGQGLALWQEHVKKPVAAVVPGRAEEVEVIGLRNDPIDQ